jgi:hypothetical protein
LTLSIAGEDAAGALSSARPSLFASDQTRRLQQSSITDGGIADSKGCTQAHRFSAFARPKCSDALSQVSASFTFEPMRESFHPIPFFFLMRHATRLLLPPRGH